MRVLHLHSGNLYGGVETLLATLAREASRCPALEHSFALCFEGRLSEELRAASASPVHMLGATRVRSPLSMRSARRTLARLLERGGFDACICHSSWSQSIFAPVVRRAARLPLVFWMHAPASGTHWLERWARRTAPDLVVCNSRFTTESARRLYPRTRAEVVYYPVSDVGARLPQQAFRASVRAELGTPEGMTIIAQVGRMEPLKGHAMHLEALGLLKDVPGWVCWQVGGAQRPFEAEYLAELKRLAAHLGIAERVVFLGERKDVPRLLAAANIYCQPNAAPETFGLTFIESLRAGLPVVTTAIGGALEIVDDSCGILVPHGDARSLAASLRTLIEQPAVRLELGSRGPARVRELCDPARQIQRLHQLFSDV